VTSDPRETARSEVLDLAALVDYQDGAVVSRTVIERKTGTVTLFAFDEGQALSEHTAPFDALVHVLEGNAEVSISGNAMNLGPGRIVVMPAREPHAVRALSRFKMLLTMIRGE
jgi:quercetin dioxygenase-like cupin family protein